VRLLRRPEIGACLGAVGIDRILACRRGLVDDDGIGVTGIPGALR
jgi:hypothetical protein